MTAARVLLWGLALGLLVASVWAWPHLPDRIPLHFGADGLPDRWGDRSLWGWFLLPLIGLAMGALMDGIGRWSLRHPEKQTINLPQAKDLMALPVERRVPVLRKAAGLLLWVGVGIQVAFVLFQVGSFAASRGEPSQAWTLAGLAISLLGSPVAVVWGIVAISNEIARQKREA